MKTTKSGKEILSYWSNIREEYGDIVEARKLLHKQEMQLHWKTRGVSLVLSVLRKLIILGLVLRLWVLYFTNTAGIVEDVEYKYVDKVIYIGGECLEQELPRTGAF